MDGINADIAGFAVGLGFAPLADVRGPGSGLLYVASLANIGIGLPQVVQMGYRDRGQALVVVSTKQRIGTLTELLHRQPVGSVVALVHRRE